jgi:hypothetical protein
VKDDSSRGSAPAPFEIDRDLVDRGHVSHKKTLNLLACRVEAAGLTPLEPNLSFTSPRRTTERPQPHV